MRPDRILLSVVVLVTAACESPKTEATVVVYPSGPTVPENLLRVDLRFSEPLRPPLCLDHVRLIDVTGRTIEDAFLDFALPSRDDRRMTILLHPGRVKSGVAANLSLGRALKAGSTVTLQVDHPALRKPVRKTWRVMEADSESPQPARWTFEPPRAGTQSPFVVRLDAPISLSAESLIAIRGSDGERVSGSSRLEAGETVWRFVPSRPWQAGGHFVAAHPDLEDAAGNRPCAPFEAINGHGIGDEVGTYRQFEVVADR